MFKVFNQDFVVDERYTVTKELGQGAYGIVWYALNVLVLQYFHRAELISMYLVRQPIPRHKKELQSRK